MVTNAMTCAAAQTGVLGWLAGESGGVNARRREAESAADYLEWVLTQLRGQRQEWEDCLRHLQWAEDVRWISDAGRGYLRQVADMRVRWARALELVAEAEAALGAALEQARGAQEAALQEQQLLHSVGRAAVCG
jgi:hypothetical protein